VLSIPSNNITQYGDDYGSAGATQALPLGEQRRLRMESHHDGDETKEAVFSFVQDFMEGLQGF
jgi:hypothetical protein